MFRPEHFAELLLRLRLIGLALRATPTAPNRKGNIFFMARPPLLCERVNELSLRWTGVGSANNDNSGMEITETSSGNLFGSEWTEIAEPGEASIIDAGVKNEPAKPRLKPIDRRQM